MSTDVATIDPQVSAALDQLAALKVMVRDASAEEATTIAEQARMAREWLKIQHAAAELREQAVTLELEALRRCGQVGATTQLTTARAAIAKRLAAMSDETFESVLAGAKASATPQRVLKDYDFALGLQRQSERIRRTLRGEEVDAGDLHDVDLGVAAEAAGTLIEQLAAEGEPFTTSQAAERLSYELGQYMSGDFWRDREVRRGLEQLVGCAVRRADAHAAGGRRVRLVTGDVEMDVPAFVTYQDAAVGKVWLRVPWDSAHLNQLEAMAQYRAEQARQMIARARDLDVLVAALRASAAQEPAETFCQPLLARVSVAAEDEQP